MSEMLDKQILEEIRLTNRLLARFLIKDSVNQTEKIIKLGSFGFSPSAIADLLNIKDNIVTSTLSKARKAEALKRKTKSAKVS